MSDNIVDAMPFSKLMGVKITKATKDLIEGELEVRPEMCTANNIIHGGAVMAFADALGGVGAFLNLPEGAVGTTTVESSTKFLNGAKEGSTVYAVTTPVKVGKSLSVWQTMITDDSDRQIALVTQTQMAMR